MRQYGNALESMSNEAVEYVRGIPVVKTFGQSVFSFKKFKATIDEYEKWVIAYTKELRMPMMLYTAAINGVFAFLIVGGLLFTRNGVTSEFLLNLLFYIIITPVISLTLTRIMYMSENETGGGGCAGTHRLGAGGGTHARCRLFRSTRRMPPCHAAGCAFQL